MKGSNYFNFKQILIKNLKSIGEDVVVFDFEEGFTLLKGEVGEGKSAIFDGLFYGLYGKTLSTNRDTKVKIGDIINSINGTNMTVMITFSRTFNNVEKEYVLTRGQKESIFFVHELNKPINLHKLDKLPINKHMCDFVDNLGTKVPFEGENVKESSNKFIKEYLRINSDMFLISRLASTKNLDFANFNDANRHKTIIEVFDAKWTEDAVEECKEERKLYSKPMDKAETQLEILKNKLEDANIQLTESKAKLKEQEDEIELKKSSLLTLKDNKIVIVDDLEKIEDNIKKLKEDVSKKDKFDSINFKIEQHNKLYNISKTNTEDAYKESQDNLNEQLDAVQTKLDDINNKEFKHNIDTINKKIEELDTKIEESTKLKNDKESLKSQLDIVNKDIEDVNQKIESLVESKLEKDKYYISEVTRINEEVKSYGKDLKESDKPFDVLIDELREKEKTLLEKSTEHKVQLKNDLKDKAFYNNEDLNECSQCKQTITDNLKKEKLDEIEKRQLEIETSLDEIEKAKKEITLHIIKTSENMKHNDNTLKTLTSLNSELTNLKVNNSEAIDTINTRIEELTKTLETNTIRHNEINEKYLKSEEFNQDELSKLNTSIDKLKLYSNNYNETQKTIYTYESEIEILKNKLAVEIKYTDIVNDSESILAEYNSEIESLDYDEVTWDYDYQDLDRKTNEKTDLDTKLIELNTSIRLKTEEIDSIKLEDCNSIELKKSNIEEEIEEVQKEYDENSKQLTILNNIINIFTNKDMRGVLFSKHVNILNHYIKGLCEFLNIPFSMKLENDFKVSVGGYGYGNILGTFSNGQQHMINVIMFATFEVLVTTMNKFDCNLILLDEYFDTGMSDARIREIMKLVKDIYKDKSVVIITHKAFSNSDFDRQYEAVRDLYTKLKKIEVE